MSVERRGVLYPARLPTVIRRRRLQEAAQRLRTDPSTGLAALAAQLGYNDQAHLATEFRTVLGFTPSAYRNATKPPAPPAPAGARRGRGYREPAR